MPVWMQIAEWSARIVMLGLIGLSIWSVAIMIDRKRFFNLIEGKNAGSSTENFKERAMSYLNRQSSPEAIERNFESFVDAEKPIMEKGLSVLGTLGGTAPFIGLLGTVLGIIKAFGELSVNSMNTNKIMFSLAEALILTAIGLAVAIPCVVAFNYFQKKVRNQVATVRVLKNELINQLVTRTKS